MNQSIVRFTFIAFIIFCVWVTALVLLSPQWFGNRASIPVNERTANQGMTDKSDMTAWSLKPALIVNPLQTDLGGELYFGTDIPALKNLVLTVEAQTNASSKATLSPLQSAVNAGDSVTQSSFARSVTATYPTQSQSYLE